VNCNVNFISCCELHLIQVFIWIKIWVIPALFIQMIFFFIVDALCHSSAGNLIIVLHAHLWFNVNVLLHDLTVLLPSVSFMAKKCPSSFSCKTKTMIKVFSECSDVFCCLLWMSKLWVLLGFSFSCLVHFHRVEKY